ncbi:MAG: hypothetical protein AAGJ95_11885 [Cyanobacteria bacterium J06554_11]
MLKYGIGAAVVILLAAIAGLLAYDQYMSGYEECFVGLGQDPTCIDGKRPRR